MSYHVVVYNKFNKDYGRYLTDEQSPDEAIEAVIKLLGDGEVAVGVESASKFFGIASQPLPDSSIRSWSIYPVRGEDLEQRYGRFKNVGLKRGTV